MLRGLHGPATLGGQPAEPAPVAAAPVRPAPAPAGEATVALRTVAAPAGRHRALETSGDAALLPVVRRARRGDALPHVALRWTRHLFGGSSEDERARAAAAEGLRRPVSTGRRVAVRGVRGGAGATTVAALLATAYALRRRDAVLAVDAVPELGWLAWRLGIAPDDDRDLDAAVGPVVNAPVTSFEQLYVLPCTPAGLRVLPGGTGAGRVTAARAIALLARHFAVAVLDQPPLTSPEPTPTGDAARTAPHVIALVAPASPDGVRRVLAALPEGSAGPVVVLVSQDRRGEGVRIGRALDAVRDAGGQPYHLPYDRHLAAGAGIDPGRLADRTARVVSELGAELLGLAVEAGHGGSGLPESFWSGRSRR